MNGWRTIAPRQGGLDAILGRPSHLVDTHLRLDFWATDDVVRLPGWHLCDGAAESIRVQLQKVQEEIQVAQARVGDSMKVTWEVDDNYMLGGRPQTTAGSEVS